MIIRNFPKQTNNLLPFELNSNKFLLITGILIMVIQDHIKY